MNLCLTNRPFPQAFIHFNGVGFTLKFSLEDVNYYWCFTALLVFYSKPGWNLTCFITDCKSLPRAGLVLGFFFTIQCFQGAYLADTPVNSPCSSPIQLYLSHLICSAHTARLCFSPQVSKGSVVNRLFITQLFPVIGDITGCRSHIVLIHLSIELRYCQITANFF